MKKQSDRACFFCEKINPCTRDVAMELNKQELCDRLICTYNMIEALKTMIEGSPDTFYVTDGDGVVILVNEAYEKLSLVNRDEILGKDIRELEGKIMTPSATLMVLEEKRAITLEQQTFSSGRKSFVTSNPVFDGDDIRFVVSTNRDLKEISKLNLELIKERERSNKYHEELQELKKKLAEDKTILAKDQVTLEALIRSKKVAKSNANVLLVGETGTGKSLFAKLIHEESERFNTPFVTIDCSTISGSLLESELFGYEKGAFTGALSEGKKGLLELGNGGTVFLDEIGELPLELQAKLLRVIQEKDFYRIGGTEKKELNVRFIMATNRNLQEMIKAGKFRQDLFYRISTVSIEIPPLRERPLDIIPLGDYFLKACNEQYNQGKTISSDAWRIMRNYSWPGNIRELRNVIEEAVIMSDGDIIEGGDINFILRLSEVGGIKKDGTGSVEFSFNQSGADFHEYIEKVEYELLRQAYSRAKSVRKAAALLKMSPATYSRRYNALKEKFMEEESLEDGE